MRLILVLGFCLFAASVAAQSGPLGIGFAQAEEGTWLCRDAEPEEGLACAREQCSEQAPGQDCVRSTWCFPAGWSGLMTMWSGDFHTTKIICGAPDEAALMGALASFCSGEKSATHCDLFNVIDPEGNERAIEGRRFLGAAPTAEAPPADGAPDEAAPSEPPAGGG